MDTSSKEALISNSKKSWDFVLLRTEDGRDTFFYGQGSKNRFLIQDSFTSGQSAWNLPNVESRETQGKREHCTVKIRVTLRNSYI